MSDAGRLVPIQTKIQKPLPGAPCNGCGACCLATKCALAMGIFGPEREGPCPALEWTGERSVCGLVANPARYNEGAAPGHSPDALGKAALCAIAAGVGCDSRKVGDPEYTPEFLERQQEWIKQNMAGMVSAFVAWLGLERARAIITWLMEKERGRG